MRKYYVTLEEAVRDAYKDRKAVQTRMPNSAVEGMFYVFISLFGYHYKKYFIDYKGGVKK